MVQIAVINTGVVTRAIGLAVGEDAALVAEAIARKRTAGIKERFARPKDEPKVGLQAAAAVSALRTVLGKWHGCQARVQRGPLWKVRRGHAS